MDGIELDKNRKGFSLIELMIVIAILGILAAIAVPSYQGYMIKSRVSELMDVANVLKTSVSEYIMANQGAKPITNAAAGLAPPTDSSWTASGNVASAWVDSGGTGSVSVKSNKTGIVLPTLNDTVTIVLTPTAAVGGPGSITWTCGSLNAAGAVSPYAPSVCRTLGTAYGVPAS